MQLTLLAGANTTHISPDEMLRQILTKAQDCFSAFEDGNPSKSQDLTSIHVNQPANKLMNVASSAFNQHFTPN